jgi:YaiO family outer membrane protein
MAVVTLGKYLGDWYFSVRSFITPGIAGTSVSASGSVRRYFLNAGTYVGVRYGHGLSKEELRNVHDIVLLASNTVAAEASVVLFDRLELGARGAFSQEARARGDDVKQYDVGTSVGFNF